MGWGGLIALQRKRRIECETENIKTLIRDYWAAGDGFHVDRLLEELTGWLARDPYDESQWKVTI